MDSKQLRDDEKVALLPIHSTDAPDRARASRSRASQLVLALACVLLISSYLSADDQVIPCRHHRLKKTADIERLFLSLPSNASIHETNKECVLVPDRAHIVRLSRLPHRAGSKRDHKTALIIKRAWEGYFGIKGRDESFDAGSQESKNALYLRGSGPRVWVDTYYPLLNRPLGGSSLELLHSNGSTAFKASLREDDLKEDPQTIIANKEVPPFLGYSPRGRVTGKLVYAHWGQFEDYEELERRNVSLKGKIVIVRYGDTFRGLKVALAEKRGAVGALIYSDPAEDGSQTEENGLKAWPHGPARNPSSLQRGSIQFLSQYAGDPLTPGWAATKHAERLPRNASNLNIPKIPTLPISYRDALPLLRSLNGIGERISDWSGGLEHKDVEYWTGGDDSPEVKLFNDVEESISPIWNTMLYVPGEDEDEAIVIGCHRDGWILGAVDPISGMSVLNEVVKAYGHLHKKGWKPHRSLLLASWDAEEYGLIGSTEFVEDHATWLGRHAKIYMNTDVAARGPNLQIKASPSLEDLYYRATDQLKITHEMQQRIHAPGSGSDFTPFLQHLGIASSDTGYQTTRDSPVYHYHSSYDTLKWMDTYGDPGFHKHVNVAKLMGLVGIRAADTPIIPLNISRYADVLGEWADEVRKIAPTDSEELTSALHTLDQTIGAVQKSSQSAYAEVHATSDKAEIARYNLKASRFEKVFVMSNGLTLRPWYRHLAVAPGRYKGYGETTFPGITEAIELDRNVTAAVYETRRLTDVLRLLVLVLKE